MARSIWNRFAGRKLGAAYYSHTYRRSLADEERASSLARFGEYRAHWRAGDFPPTSADEIAAAPAWFIDSNASNLRGSFPILAHENGCLRIRFCSARTAKNASLYKRALPHSFIARLVDTLGI